jgi:hypothetical protein
VTLRTDPIPVPDEPTGEVPVLAVAYDVTSSSPLELVDALAGRCDLVWVVEAADPALGAWARLLPRLGAVVDASDRPESDVVRDLGALGVDGIVAFTDSQLLRAARLSEALGLKGNRPGTVLALTDKLVQRQTLADAGLPGPRFTAVPVDTPVADLDGLLDGMAYPVVVKPRWGSGSRNTIEAAGPDAAVGYLRGELEGPHPVDLLVEEMLGDGGRSGSAGFASYVSVEAVASGGVVVPLAVTGKFPLAPPCRETGNFLPHHLDADVARDVESQAVRGAQALGVTSGALHIEVMLTPDGPRIIEVNGRIGGGGIDTLFAMAHGRSLTSIAAAVAVGEPPDPGPAATVEEGGYVYTYFVQAPVEAGCLESLDGLDRLQALDGVVATSVNRNVGDALDWRDGSQGYLVSVRGRVAGRDELARVPRRVAGALTISWR